MSGLLTDLTDNIRDENKALKQQNAALCETIALLRADAERLAGLMTDDRHYDDDEWIGDCAKVLDQHATLLKQLDGGE